MSILGETSRVNSANSRKASSEFETPISRSACSLPKTLIFHKKSIHFRPHTRGNLKGQFCELAKILKILHGRSYIFQIKYVFRCSVVTSMCVPSTWNCNLFWKYSDLQSKMLTFQSKSWLIIRIWYPYHTFCFHTEVNPKDQFCDLAKILKVLDGRSCICWKNIHFAAAWWHRCAPLLHEIILFL